MNSFLYNLAQIDTSSLPGSPGAGGGLSTEQSLQVIIQLVFGIFGIVAVLIITIAGFQYVLSQGDPQKTAKAKDTILYAIIGLTVTILSFGIVTFVIDKV